jgi:hypothetical protein
MRFRKLRIAWSVVWGLAAVQLIVLWVRSCRWCDIVVWGTSAQSYGHINSCAGGLTRGSFRLESRGGTHHSRSSFKVVGLEFEWLGMEGYETATRLDPDLVSVPYWALIAVCIAIGTASWLPIDRFSLRTLLIATTLVAVVLGVIVYAAR